VDQIYDFRTGNVKPECLHEGWQTSGSVKIVRMAFNLYCGGTPSIFNYDDSDLRGQLEEVKRYGGEHGDRRAGRAGCDACKYHGEAKSDSLHYGDFTHEGRPEAVEVGKQ